MYSMTIELDPRLEPLYASLSQDLLSQKQLNTIAVQEGETLTRSHFALLAAERHRPGVGVNFWEKAAKSITAADLGDSTEIRISQVGVAQRYYGGKIEPVNKKFLAIPIPGTEAEGRSTKEFDDLIPMISALTSTGVLAKDGKPLFMLLKSITQDPDSSVLPSDEAYINGISAQIQSSITAKMEALTK